MLKLKNLIFIGAPGAGKGTFSAILREKHDLLHISTGDLLREEIKQGTKLGKEAEGLMKEGKLVPDEIVSGMVKDRLSRPDAGKGFILDGFPRTVRQAKLLEQALDSLNKRLDRVVYFAVDDDTLLQRLTARESCRNCGAIYNKLFMPAAKAGVCDRCAGELFQRPDDSLETAKARLKVFYEQTSPLIDFYRDAGLLQEITETDKEKLGELLERELGAF